LDFLGLGSEQYKSYYIDNKPPPPDLDQVTEVFYEKVGQYYQELLVRPQNSIPWSRVLMQAAKTTYGITQAEVEAVIAWVRSESASPQLQSALDKMNPIRSWVITTTPLTEEALVTLKGGGPGWASRGEPGVYALRGR
jgi:hypothetical protein